MNRKEKEAAIIAFLRKAGTKGGKARAKATTHEQRSEWAALGSKEREQRKRQREREQRRKRRKLVEAVVPVAGIRR